MIAVANGYFSTVELNDGQVLTSFDPDCQRTENGVSTTRGSAGSAAIAQGCEAQFKLGIYHINKRVRERRYPIVDEERGVVVGTAFFDHANAFDTYKTTDGQVRKTVLKWPNSLSLMEAFKIRNGLIYRVEAVFTYIPYFTHSPWTGPGAAYDKDIDRKPTGKALRPRLSDRRRGRIHDGAGSAGPVASSLGEIGALHGKQRCADGRRRRVGNSDREKREPAVCHRSFDGKCRLVRRRGGARPTCVLRHAAEGRGRQDFPGRSRRPA